MLQFSFDFYFHEIFFFLSPHIQSLYVSSRQNIYIYIYIYMHTHTHIYGFCFYMLSTSVCLLVEAFNPFTFKVIIYMYILIGIFLMTLLLSL